MAKKATSSSVRVAVRVRPENAEEANQASARCLSVSANQISAPPSPPFRFDAVFPASSKQTEIYADSVSSLVDTFFQGYNATIFAYGQTGSGKTYTMGNEFGLDVKEEQKGIIPRVMTEIFARIKEGSDQAMTYTLRLSYLQILNEEIQDLLSPSTCKASLSIRDDGQQGVMVAGLNEKTVVDEAEVASLLMSGISNRATATTDMNATSSRSHAICTLIMEASCKNEETGLVDDVRVSKFHLVDLAGSERAKKTNATGERFKEGVNINKSLLALGNVINALSSGQADGKHIPYRDSKVTRLLQDSLGGNSKTLMIACVSPADLQYEETISTLRYAARAKKIKNNAKINRDPITNEANVLREHIQLLQLQLLQANNGKIDASSIELLEKIKRLEEEVKQKVLEINMLKETKDKWKEIAVGHSSNSNNNELVKEIEQFEIKQQALISNDTAMDNGSSSPSRSSQHDLDDLSASIAAREKIMKFLTNSTTYNSTNLACDETIAVGHLDKLYNKYTSRIQELESEVQTLLKKSSSSDNGRNEKYTSLKKDLNEMKTYQKECQRLLKLNKSGQLKISNLQQEVVKMKQQKASMQRKLKEEMELHRKEKKMASFKILQLKRTDEKKKMQLAKLANLHEKQSNVLKRKNEEVIHANKRLKTILHKQTTSKTQQKQNSVEQILAKIQKDIDIQVTIKGSKQAIKNEMQLRKKMATEMKSDDQKLIEKTSYIRNLQHTLQLVEKNYSSKPKISFSNTPSDCHQLIRLLINMAVEDRIRCSELQNLYEQNTQFIYELEEEKEGLEIKQSQLSTEFTELLQKTDLESIKMKAMEEENNQLKLELAEATLRNEKKKKKKKQAVVRESLSNIFTSDSDMLQSENDSDYTEEGNKAKLSNRKKGKKRPSSNSSISSKPSNRSSTNSSLNMSEIDSEKNCCNCAGKCATNRCWCKQNKSACGGDCQCKESKCRNRSLIQIYDESSSLEHALKKKKKEKVDLNFQNPEDKENDVVSRKRDSGAMNDDDKENTSGDKKRRKKSGLSDTQNKRTLWSARQLNRVF